MSTSFDSQHVPQHVEQPGLEYEFPQSIEYHDTASWSDSDLRETCSQDLDSLPSAELRRRGVESFDDLRKAIKQRGRRTERIADLSPICPIYSGSTASGLGDRTEETPPGVGKVCENCLGMNAENMAQPGGYKHSSISELSKSMKWCELCGLLSASSAINVLEECTSDRYQIVVSLRERGDDVEVRPDSTRGRRPRSPTGHGNTRPDFRDSFSQLVVEVIDLRPWEEPEYETEDAIFNEAEMPRTFLASDGSKLSIVHSSRLSCLTEEHDPATDFGVEHIRQIGSDTSRSRSFDIAAGWLASCRSAGTQPKLENRRNSREHYAHIEPYCGHKSEGSKILAFDNEAASLTAQDPLRLVEIQPGTRDSAPTVRLIHTNGHHQPYAALSYCWGKAPPGDHRSWQTTQATLKSHLQGINRRHLPQTLQDAIYICERLHIFYLWVDSLCIVQDSDIDWATESAKMSGIYLRSLLTISLSASTSAESGCLNYIPQRIFESERSEGEWVKIETKLKDGRSSLLYISGFPSLSSVFQREVQEGALARRAWALQEHIMPQRTLYVTSKQLLWECKHCRLSEDNYPQLQADRLYPICDYGFPLDATAIFEIWYYRVVENYMQRQLTYDKDRLVAISALARATYINRQVDYVAGLWRDCIVPGLLWRRGGPGCKSKTYSCPTWSWASQNSPVTYVNAIPLILSLEPRPSESFPRVQNVSWDTKPENPFGDVLSAHIDLDTTIALGNVLRDGTFYEEDLWFHERNGQTLIIPGSGQNRTLCAEAAMDDADRGGRNVVVANMGHCFLLLEPPSLSSGEYRRVGIAFISPSKSYKERVYMDDLTHWWEQRTIRLV